MAEAPAPGAHKAWMRKQGSPGVAAARGWTLHGPAAAGDESTVKRLINQGAQVNSQDEDGWTPLRWAVQHGHMSIMRLLIKAGAEVDTRFGKKEKTSLHHAAYQGREDVCKLLLEAKAEVNPKDTDGFCPYDVVFCPKDDRDTVRNLLASYGGKHARPIASGSLESNAL
mmetsp:Transcript_48161/g.114607  ORF Transcript_48161/g.114607 Transcript_48161/m.114607 type:complete len:169 (+) Transcript_48161:29-535(+)